MQQTSENSTKRNTKTITPGILVCQGAICQCDKSTVTARMQVVSHQKYFINNNLLVATDQDRAVTSLYFGACMATGKPEPCVPALQWEVTGDGPVTQHNARFLLDTFTATCTLKGGRIRILHHGQQMQPGPANWRHINNNTAALLQPLLPADTLTPLQQPPARPVTVQQLAIRTPFHDNNGQLSVRAGQSHTFEVSAYGADNPTPAATEKQQISWKVYRTGDSTPLYHFSQQGETLTLVTDTGTLLIEAWDEVHQTPPAQLTIQAGDNYLLYIDGPADFHYKTMPTYYCYFAFPPTPAELVQLHWILTDQNECILTTTSDSTVFEYFFTSEGTYTLSAYLADHPSQSVEKIIHATCNQVIRLTSTHTRIRPGETATFSLILKYDTTILQDEGMIRWQQQAPTGIITPLQQACGARSCTLSFSLPGRYIIEAATDQRHLNFAGSDQQEILVCQNAVQMITMDKRPRTGANLTFRASRFIFPRLTAAESRKLHWQLEGPENIRTYGGRSWQHTFEKTGKYQLYAFLYDQQAEARLEFEVVKTHIHSGKWIDSDGNVIREAGYDQEVCIYFEHTGLENETITLEIYHQQLVHHQLLHTQTLQLPATTKVYHAFYPGENIRKKTSSNGQPGKLYFKIIPENTLPSSPPDQLCPLQEKDYLQLTETRKICKAYFSDVRDRKQFLATSRQQSATLKIYALNLCGQQLQVSLLQVKKAAPLSHPLTPYPTAVMHQLIKDDDILQTGIYTVDKKGEVNLQLDLSQLPAQESCHMVYAMIRMPGFNCVYTGPLLVYRENNLRLPDAIKGRTIVAVERVQLQSATTSGCQELVWGNKVSCAFRRKVIAIATQLQADPNHLMTCMAFETGGLFLPYLLNGYNKNTTPLPDQLTDKQLRKRAVGLIQFTHAAIKGINQRKGLTLTKRQLAEMSAEQQLDYVHYYLEPFATRLTTLEDFYMAVLKPVGIGKSNDYPVFSVADDEKRHRNWYRANKGLDKDQDLVVTKAEVSVIIHTKYTEGLLYKNTCSANCPLQPEKPLPAALQWHHPTDNLQLRGWYRTWSPDSSKYGLISQRSSGKHQGLDFYAPAGSPVYACVSGQIHASYFSSSYGHVIVLQGNYKGNTYYFMYAHLQQSGIYKAGESVTIGTLIGYTGKTGNATTLQKKQEHLHFEIRTKEQVQTGFHGRLNPLDVITELNDPTILTPHEQDQQ
ncbi:peptidoglycan DD-metalloendopeptidase family protein [Chitinophaga nivalis]|uniref:Peptidoglycan DD-metalloendopeptidase family protein n=1 Tax=Chitinophaga nivalis TaxID=2991709 RepID=A0ABT3IT25_9BACT|nr:peptidoglycan DD-metalloendopeptidase family protein [Chitinophaga nivalis]MCW3463182.1 peptidoglycan DD-metalloendopeptidase family protein [Chitinophaga nivalis]MCW3487128.1 peptidoglycan DD-metalloendopeptidase family protein [Chitinophaga nivalis]